jgi:hypothetical protein
VSTWIAHRATPDRHPRCGIGPHAFLPFHPWALAVLVGASALAATLIGRPGDAITPAITTTVVLVVAAVSPEHAWQ